MTVLAVVLAAEAGGGIKKSPIWPATNEIVWGSISFLILFVLLAKLAYPQLKASLDARAEKIRRTLDEAESTRGEAQEILEEYRSQLADAKSEASRIVEEARQAADKLRQDLRRQAEAEVAELRERNQQDMRAEVDRAMSALESRVGDLVLELAEKVVEKNLDRETNLALIDRYIQQVGAGS